MNISASRRRRRPRIDRRDRSTDPAPAGTGNRTRPARRHHRAGRARRRPGPLLIADAPDGTLDLLAALDGGRVGLGGARRHAPTAPDRRRRHPAPGARRAGRPRPAGPGRWTGRTAPARRPSRRTGSRWPPITDTGHGGGGDAPPGRRGGRRSVAAGGSPASVASVLAAAGVGHVHLQPDRRVAGRGRRAGRVGRQRAHRQCRRPRRRDDQPGSRTDRGRPGGAPAGRPGVRWPPCCRRVSPQVRVHPPTGRLPPAVVVLAGDTPPAGRRGSSARHRPGAASRGPVRRCERRRRTVRDAWSVVLRALP